MRKALITGITGQDGSYLTEFLLQQGYEVHGIIRRASNFNTERIDHLYPDSHAQRRLFLHYGDLMDSSSLNRVLEEVRPGEIYNLGAQSHVHISFQIPEFTAETNAIGTLRILDAIRKTGIATRFYQASSSELYGGLSSAPLREDTPFHPRSPYAVAKLYAYWITVNHREAYGMYTVNGTLFNHESPRRGEVFVTRKVTRAAVRISQGKQDRLYIGNLEARRDWGYAKEYVEAMWLMLQQPEPDDYVIATGSTHSVRELCELAFAAVGIDLAWEGEGLDEKGIDRRTARVLVEVDPRYFRPAEVDHLTGDPSKARAKLGWRPRTSFPELVELMVAHDLEHA
ncbi:GDP-mannose 4,6-dehydratase [Nocardia puris]|uniref:GDP-mannose 4,6-dehydratase n=1 Tax=Nocardia puris TaxID=208602 RepID=A0A366DLH9_9NOCA|nr:GDP-mannose 4,6-dehydratase [Nocardia puris]MBF6212917.1 GDP-mannose 4,6-dehydratase [Nocardia puris]MBF6367908.1 GDP-mannose 4,6-dehydratase [Nocardia puris]MBF6463257.1 GDP-mannose 4,6-dehydratase [Nocardia puris]RBO90164.1 GDPmannose 4,6-dehydratase [Nocardia puris]